MLLKNNIAKSLAFHKIDNHIELEALSLVQDGYVCMKRCPDTNAACKANITMSISYQFNALPSLRNVRLPIKVTFIFQCLKSRQRNLLDHLMKKYKADLKNFYENNNQLI